MKRLNLNTTHLMLYRTALLLLFALFLICPSPVLAGTVGSNIAIASKAYDQQNPHTIYLTDPTNPDIGRWFVVWEDWRNYSTTGADIYGQFIDSTGAKCGSEFVVANGKSAQNFRIGNGTSGLYSRTMPFRPITKRSVVLYTGTPGTPGYMTCVDNGLGTIGGSCVTGSVNYSTGAISNIRFSQVVPVGQIIYVQYTSNTNQTAPRASYRIEDGKIVVVWQDTRANYVYYNTLTNINFTNCTNPMTTVGTETSIGFNGTAEYDPSTLATTPAAPETIGTSDCNTTEFADILSNPLVDPGSVSVTVGSQTLVDDSHGKLTGSGEGTIDYNNGVISAKFSSAPGLNPPGCNLTIPPCACVPPIPVVVNYDYFSSFPPTTLPGTDNLISRQQPRIAYDPTGDRFWVVWKETRNILHRFSHLCFENTVGYISDWEFDDSDFIGYVRLDGQNLSEDDSAIAIPGADIIRNVNSSTQRFLTGKITPLEETRIYESFKFITNPDVSCDSTSTQCLIVFEGLRMKQTQKCTCTDKNANGGCDLADIITDTLENEAFDDGLVHIYGITDNYMPLEVIESAKLDTSDKASHYPSVGFDPITKRFLTAWEDFRDGTNTKIYGQLIQSGGGLYNADFIISFQDTNGDDQQDTNVAKSKQSKPFVSYDPVNQRFFVVWQDGRNSTLSLENLDIYGQKVDAEGSLRGNNFAIFTLAYNQYNPTIAYNDITSEFLTVWKDARNLRYRSCSATGGVGTGFYSCGSDVYGQRFELGNPSLTLLKMDNTALAPPLLSAFENPVGSGGVEVGLAATQSFKIRNTGDETLKVDCINEDLACNCPTPPCDIAPFSFDGLPSQLTTCGDAQTLDFAPAAELIFTVRFEPGVGGSFNRCFIIESDGGSPQINLSAFSKEANITITYPNGTLVTPPPPPPIPLYDFGTVNVGDTLDKTFVVRNAGVATLSISSIDNPTTPFSIQSNNCTSVAPGATCNIVVRFKPTAIGLVSSQFSIHSNDPDTPILTIPIQGTGQGAPHMTVSPLTVNFGNVQVTQTGQQIITIASDGTLPLTINSFSALAVPFSSSHNCPISPLTLAVGNSCQLTVSFTPTTTGGVSSNITITPAVVSPVTVNLSGTGVTTPHINVTPNNLTFPSTPVGSSSSLNVTVSNTGTANLNITSLTNPTGAFSITGNTCPFTIIPGAPACQITIAFSPTASGYQSSTFTINSNDPVTPAIPVFLSGTGSVVPQIRVTPSPLNFGNVQTLQTSTLNLSVTNIGTGNLTITSVAPPASPFSITANSCNGASLAQNATCQITVKFAPTSPGAASSSISITSNDPGSPTSVTLNGNGVAAPQILVTTPTTPLALNFGSIKAGTISAPQTITVTNNGGSNLVLGTTAYPIINPRLPYRVTANTCQNASLANSASCTITIVFNPTSTGYFYPYYMYINSNDTTTPKVTITLSGVGIR